MKRTLHNKTEAVSHGGYSFFSLVPFRKKFRQQYLLLFLILPFCSCSMYQLTTLQSSDMTADKDQGVFTMENDSVRITYSLGDVFAPPLTVEIFNKLDEPLLVDWSRSSLVYNGNAIRYFSTEANFIAKSRGYSIDWTDDFSTQRSKTQGKISLPKETDFIPPHSSIKNTLLNLPTGLLATIPDTALHPYELRLNYAGQPLKSKYGRFTAANSPLIMSSYLTLYPNDKINSTTIVYKNHFYASEIVSTKQEPASTIYMSEQRGYRFYLKGKAEGSPVTTAPASSYSGAAPSTPVTVGGSTKPVVKQ